LKESLTQDFNQIIIEEYGQIGFEEKTKAFDELQQRVNILFNINIKLLLYK
jgi:hypothetical protein